MGLEKLHKDHFIQRLEALQKNLNDIIFASKGLGQLGQESLEGFRDPSSDISCILDIYGQVLQVSAGFTIAFGYPYEQIANKNVLEFVAGPQKKATKEFLDKLGIGFPMVKFQNFIRCSNNELMSIQWKGVLNEGCLYLKGKPDKKDEANERNLQEKSRRVPVFQDFSQGVESSPRQVEIKQSPDREKGKAAAMNTVGSNGVITYVSDHWLKLLGFSRTEVMGKSCSLFFDPGSQRHIAESFVPLLEETGHVGPCDGIMNKKEGGKIKVTYTGSGDPSDTIHWVIFFKGDLKDEKEIEEKKEEDLPQEAKKTDPFSSEQNLRAIINSSNQILFLIDKNLKIIAYNKHAQETVSKRAEKNLLVGDSFLNFIPRVDIDSFKEIFADVLQGQVTHLTQELNFKRSTRWFEVHIQPVKEETDTVSSVVISAEDITDRKIAKEKFKELEINFKSIFSQVAVGVMLFNVDLESEQANRRFYEMVEYSPEEYKELGPIGITHPEDREVSTRKAAELVAGKAGHYSLEKRYVTKSGKIIWALLTATLVKNRLGKPKHIISVIQDITARKTAEQELLYKKNELDTFVYRASHDLRGPVASLMGLYNIVKREFVDNEQALDYFQHYNNSVMRLHAVLQNLIDLTKIKDSETKLTQVDIKKMVDTCVNELKELAHFNRIKFFIEANLDFKVFIDGKKFKTIIKHLVENAIMYCTPEDKAYIKINISYQENVLKMEILDNGRGIHPKIQSKVFNMFFRGTEVSSGSGLGLYIVKNAVEKLNGSIQLTSQLNEGTKVSVYIPYLYEQEYTTLLEKNFDN